MGNCRRKGKHLQRLLLRAALVQSCTAELRNYYPQEDLIVMIRR